jgi:HD-like signal output (HDOD) protein
MRTLRDPKAAVIDYIKIINKDPAMSTAVLKLANSVYFNPLSKRITSVDTSVVKLGIDGLRLVLSAAVLQPVIQRKSHFYTEFGHALWAHSLHCAVACELIAKQRALEPYKAYLLGLVHDIGKITVFSELSHQFQLNKTHDQPGYAAFAPMMQASSETLSHLVAKDWELPEEICSALEQQINLNVGDTIGPYANVLYQANLITEIYAIAKADPSQKKAAQQAVLDLNLPENLFTMLDSVVIE